MGLKQRLFLLKGSTAHYFKLFWVSMFPNLLYLRSNRGKRTSQTDCFSDALTSPPACPPLCCQLAQCANTASPRDVPEEVLQSAAHFISWPVLPFLLLPALGLGIGGSFSFLFSSSSSTFRVPLALQTPYSFEPYTDVWDL